MFQKDSLIPEEQIGDAVTHNGYDDITNGKISKTFSKMNLFSWNQLFYSFQKKILTLE